MPRLFVSGAPLLALALLLVVNISVAVVAQEPPSRTRTPSVSGTFDAPSCCCIPQRPVGVSTAELYYTPPSDAATERGGLGDNGLLYYPARTASLELTGLVEGVDDDGGYVEWPTAGTAFKLHMGLLDGSLRRTSSFDSETSLTGVHEPACAAFIASATNTTPVVPASKTPLAPYCSALSEGAVDWAAAATRWRSIRDRQGADGDGRDDGDGDASWRELLERQPGFRVIVEATEGFVPQANDQAPVLAPVVGLNIDAVRHDLLRFLGEAPIAMGTNFTVWNRTLGTHGRVVGADTVVFTKRRMYPCDSLREAIRNGSVTAPTPRSAPFDDDGGDMPVDASSCIPRTAGALAHSATSSPAVPVTLQRNASTYMRDVVARLRYDAKITICAPLSVFLWESGLGDSGGDGARDSCQRRSINEALSDPMYPRDAFTRLEVCGSAAVNVPKTETTTVAATRYLAIVTATLSVITAPPSGVGALATLDAQNLAIIGRMSCASTSDRLIARGLRFFVSPVLDLSNFSLVLLVNAQVAIFAVAGHFFIVVAQYRQRTEKRTARYKARLRHQRRRRALRKERARRNGTAAMSASLGRGGGRDAANASTMSDAGDLGTEASFAMSQSMAASSAAGSSAGGGSAIEMERMLSHGVAARLGGGVGGARIAGLDSDDDGSDEEEQLEHKLLDESRRFSMRRFTEVAANARFPSMSFLVAILAFQGIVYASVHLSTFAEDTAHSTVGVLGVLLAISFVILSTVLVQQQRLRFFPYINLHPWLKEKFESKDLESKQRWRNARTKGFLGDGKGNAADPDDVLEATRCRSVSQFDRAGGNSAKNGGGVEKLQYKWYLAWIYPLGTWGPSRQRLMYSKLFSAYTGTAKTWFVFPLLLCVGVNVITVVHPSSLRGCFIQLTCLGVLFLTAALITIIRQPMRCIYKNVLSTTAFLCFACSAAARGTNLFLMRDIVGSELGSTTPPARTAILAYRIALVSTLVQVILIGVRSLLDGLFTYLESHHWRPRNQLYLESLAEEGRDAKRQARVDLQKKRRELMMQSAAGGAGSSFRGTDGHTGWAESSLGGVPLDSDRAGLSGSSFGGDSSASGDESGGAGGGGQGLTAATLAGFEMPDDRHRGGRRFSRMNRVSTTAAETRKRSARVGRLQATADAHESNIEWLLGGKRSAPEAAPTTERAPTTKPKRRVGVKFDI